MKTINFLTKQQYIVNTFSSTQDSVDAFNTQLIVIAKENPKLICEIEKEINNSENDVLIVKKDSPKDNTYNIYFLNTVALKNHQKEHSSFEYGYEEYSDYIMLPKFEELHPQLKFLSNFFFEEQFITIAFEDIKIPKYEAPTIGDLVNLKAINTLTSLYFLLEITDRYFEFKTTPDNKKSDPNIECDILLTNNELTNENLNNLCNKTNFVSRIKFLGEPILIIARTGYGEREYAKHAIINKKLLADFVLYVKGKYEHFEPLRYHTEEADLNCLAYDFTVFNESSFNILESEQLSS
jgi:hypothetical protein